MLFDQSRTMLSSHNTLSLIQSDIPSTLMWSQTIDSITLQINVNRVQVTLTERCLKLAHRSRKITLPLYGSLYIQQDELEQMAEMNDLTLDSNKILSLTLQKENSIVWPHLLIQQTDEEVANYLLEANFFLRILYIPVPNVHPMDTLDFETVIRSEGQKTGLE